MLVTEYLMNEHHKILSYVGLMEAYAALTVKQPDSSVFMENAGHFFEFIHEFSDRFHHAKEEAGLFLALQGPGALTHCDPIGQMLLEHNKARHLVGEMELAVANKDNRKLVASTMQYTQLIKEHIFKENNILYPIADRGLSKSVQALLLEQFIAVDQKLDGPALWGKYDALAVELHLALDAASTRSTQEFQPQVGAD